MKRVLLVCLATLCIFAFYGYSDLSMVHASDNGSTTMESSGLWQEAEKLMLQGEYAQAAEKYLLISSEYGEQCDNNYALTFYYAGTCYLLGSYIEAALNCFEKSLQVAKLLNYEKLIAENCYRIGLIYIQNLGQYAKALEYFKTQYEIDIRSTDNTVIVKDLLNLGDVYFFLEQYSNSLEYYSKAEEFARQEGMEGIHAVTIIALGRAHLCLDQANIAFKYFDEGIVVLKSLNLQSDLLYFSKMIGFTCYDSRCYEKALEYCTLAFDLADKLNEMQVKGHVAAVLGDTYKRLLQYDKAIDLYNTSIKLSKEYKQSEIEIGNLRSLGDISRELLDFKAAEEYYAQVLKLTEDTDSNFLLKIRAETLIGMAICLHNEYQIEEAIQYAKEALQIEEAMNTRTSVVIDLHDLTQLYIDIGNYVEARLCAEKALDYAKIYGVTQHIKNVELSLGTTYARTGQYGKAIEIFQNQVEYYKDNSPYNLVLSLNSLAMVYSELGVYDKAIKYCTESLEIAKKNNITNLVVTCSNNIGLMYFLGNKYQEASEIFMELLKSADLTNYMNVKDKLAILNNVGLCWYYLGNNEKAITYFSDAYLLASQLNFLEDMASSLSNLGLLHISNKQYERALEFINQSVQICQQNNLETILPVNLYCLGILYSEMQDFKKSEECFENLIKYYEKLGKSVPVNLEKASYFEKSMAGYLLTAIVYGNSNNLDKVFEIMEKSKAKLFKDLAMNRSEENDSQNLPEVQKTLSANDAILILMSGSLDGILEMLIKNRDAKYLNLSTVEFIQNMRTNHNEEMDKNLKGLMAQHILNTKIPLLLAMGHYNEEIEKISQYFHKEVSHSYLPGDIARELYNLLIKPLEGDLLEVKELTIITDGLMSFIPFDTLVDEEGKYLAEKYDIRYIQSTTIDKIMQTRKYSMDRKPLLAFGGAIYAGKTRESSNNSTTNYDIYHWTDLPNSIAEVQDIQKLINGAEIYTGLKVSETDLKQLSENGELAKYKILHFATHGLALPDNPDYSAIVLSQNVEGQTEDGYLTTKEVFNLKLQADLVVLSACETALGKSYAGEGIYGLVQAFLLAGANSVITSLWKVDDEATRIFMTEFYRLLSEGKMQYSQALAEVKKRFIKGQFGDQYRNPYYWAPFVFYGSDGSIK